MVTLVKCWAHYRQLIQISLLYYITLNTLYYIISSYHTSYYIIMISFLEVSVSASITKGDRCQNDLRLGKASPLLPHVQDKSTRNQLLNIY